MRVVIVGAGIGGLALAQGLVRTGVEVMVVERDTDLRATGGYSLHLREQALRGLRTLLDPARVERLHAVAQGTWNQRGFAIRDHRARLIAVDRSFAETDALDVDRITLRLLLADGIGEHLSLGTRGTGYTSRPDGTVVVHTEREDGTREDMECDVLVAADGVGSAVATQLAGRPTSVPIGLVGIAGRTPETVVPASTADLLGRRSTLAVGPGGSGLYVGHHAALDQAAVRSFVAPPPWGVPPSYVWGVILLDWAGTEALRSRSGTALVDGAVAALRDRSWSGPMLDLLDRASPETASAFRFHASPRYAAGLAPWQAGPVTALGDAVHAMPPTGGQGASTALRDAALLHAGLLEVREGRTTVSMAVHDYHLAMRPYAAAAISESLQPVTWIRASAKPLGAAVARAGLPAAAAVSWAVRAGRRGDPHLA